MVTMVEEVVVLTVTLFLALEDMVVVHLMLG